jgi:transposase-like protein
MTDAMADADKPAKVKRTSVRRQSSPASVFHMSKDAIDVSVEKFAKMSDLQCVQYMAKVRWGSFTQVTCPHCSTSSDHCFSKPELRWKCRGCGKRFSVTSKTVFANRRLSHQKLLSAIHLFASGAAGKPALELRRMLNIGGYNSAYSLVSKLREGLLRGSNIGLISGVIEMDGAHASGRRASEKRAVALEYDESGKRKVAVEPEATGSVSKPVPEQVRSDDQLTNISRQKQKRDQKITAEKAGLVVDPQYGAHYPSSRRIVWTLRKRSEKEGRGATVTRVGIGMAETPEIAMSLATAYIAIPESILATDSGTAFSKLGKKFQCHFQVNHSETLSGPNGEHNNFAESYGARQDRAEKGIYLNIEAKYLCDYAVETAFREDHRRLAPGAIGSRLLHHALNVGLSQYWRGFTHGHHRDFEILHPANQVALPSGPKKGKSPISSINGRPPR